MCFVARRILTENLGIKDCGQSGQDGAQIIASKPGNDIAHHIAELFLFTL